MKTMMMKTYEDDDDDDDADDPSSSSSSSSTSSPFIVRIITMPHQLIVFFCFLPTDTFNLQLS